MKLIPVIPLALLLATIRLRPQVPSQEVSYQRFLDMVIQSCVLDLDNTTWFNMFHPNIYS